MGGAILVAGTTSDAGKSLITAGLCRAFLRRGLKVAPFKAQNMSNNSVVTLDGGEIGRAQAMQARACGLEPSVRFNPVLLKPGSDRTSQLVVRGKAVGQVSARNYAEHRAWLRELTAAELASLREEFDVVICEGAGSPAEINLRATDIANMGLARAADIPVVVVGDIDRGGVLAHMFGTLAVLDPADQALIAGFIVNKFRGDVSLLQPGLDQLEQLTGRRVFGVVPFADRLWLDAEDSLGTVTDRPVGVPQPPIGDEWLRVAAIRLPRISNSTDVEALACEPGVAVSWVTDPAQVAAADLVVVPGSKSTVSDLAWLRERGLADALTARTGPVLAICGGYQMLGKQIIDDVESGQGVVDGLGLLDLDIEFAPDKVLRQTEGTAHGLPVQGYEIHHGRVVRSGDPTWFGNEGSARGNIRGTHWHGLLANDDFRRAYVTEVAISAGRRGFQVAPDTSVESVRETALDAIADLLEENVQVGELLALAQTASYRADPIVRHSLET
ncbi:cobyric acid synthase [Smaragdicoccus niigatensis]|uniref:cobyric acid synthase n=1 Tax=Smaragdicoccus niigatensis TaxID=359359 RepID=UPI00036AF23B|nr:cobyric acid synthase [Smaragdicoccus niigatensis]